MLHWTPIRRCVFEDEGLQHEGIQATSGNARCTAAGYQVHPTLAPLVPGLLLAHNQYHHTTVRAAVVGQPVTLPYVGTSRILPISAKIGSS
jgi:hypothetical protein